MAAIQPPTKAAPSESSKAPMMKVQLRVDVRGMVLWL